jgi:multimeric flavodoxin WrbA
MKITAINGSPKGENSSSREIIRILEARLPDGTDVQVVSQIAQDRHPDDSALERMASSDVLFIASSLFVDGLPASLMRLLGRYAEYPGRPKGQRVFAIVNCGFYEGVQNEHVLAILGHWCAAAGFVWCGGAGLGTGEMIYGLKNVPPTVGIRKPVIAAINAVADAIARGPEGRLADPVYAQHAFPWILFKLAGEAGWRAQAKENGLKARDLFARPLEPQRLR